MELAAWTTAIGTVFSRASSWLDSAYRFVISAMLVFWISGYAALEARPVQAWINSFNWFGVDVSPWLVPAAGWIEARAEYLGMAAHVMVALGVIALCINYAGRGGSTLLLGVVVAAQADAVYLDVAGILAVAFVVVMVAWSLGAWRLRSRGVGALGPWTVIGDRFAKSFVGLIAAALTFLTPFLWALAGGRSERRVGGSRFDPMHIEVTAMPREAPASVRS